MAALVAGCSLCGLALQQYAWYTACTSIDCWADEAPPVLFIMVLSSLLLGLMGIVFATLLALLGARALVLGGMCALLLVAPRLGVWVIGSLYDGVEKAKWKRDL